MVERVTSSKGAATVLLERMRDPKAVLCHGDLWSGNTAVGRIHHNHNTEEGEVEEGEEEGEEAVIFDPSATYAPAEYDHGIMKMYPGGVFTNSFWREYWKYMSEGGEGGKEEPVEEYDDRVELYEAYHQLNHYSFFGGGYKDAAVRILERLEGKYGGKE